MQSRLMSLVESVSNALLSFATGVVTQWVVFPLFGIHVSLGQNVGLVLTFMGVSVVRTYVVRRVFSTVRWLR